MAPGWYPPVISLGDGDSTVTQQWSAPPRESISRVDASDLGNRSKLRKVERACDYCRRRKSKCDGPQKKDHICSSCEANSRTCTYLVDSKPRGPSKAYIAALENRSEKVEALLRRLRPEVDLAVELGPCQLSNDRKTEGNSRPSSAGANLSRRGSSSNLVPRAGAEKDSDVSKVAQSAAATYLGYRSQAVLHDSSDSDEQEVTFSEGRRLTSRGLESSSEQKPNIHQLRFQGKSSSLNLISTTMELIQRELAAMHISESDAPPSDQTKSSSVHHPRVFCKLNPEASELYSLLPWEKRLGPGIDMAAVSDNLLAAFPPDDLAEELIRLFFLREHVTFPLLHRPTFERQWRDKLYLRDGWFASVCMAVFGLASRWTTDPRVLSRGDQSEPEGSGTGVALASLPGWQYVSVTIMASAAITERQSGLLIPPELCEIQTLVLLSQYLRGTEGADTAWFWLSVGVVKTQDMGLHRRQTYGRTPTIEDELWKRAYWHLVALDRFGSMLLGKPYFAREEEWVLHITHCRVETLMACRQP
ncbi:fungal-specific transcription factor domain-containing protein [Lenzites betulinus]|nr:fungal-specific transcription factor domain-containing protein [Lenzites betulinus]